MTTKKELIEQSELAFDFIQKLYLEVSYLIKEIEVILNDEVEEFVIGKPGGYAVSSKSSSGLESKYVKLWLLRKFAVFFVPQESTEKKGGQLITKINKDLKVIYLRFKLNDTALKEPEIIMGVLHDIETKNKWEKFEHLMGFFEYNDEKVFKDINNIQYEDATVSLKGKLHKVNLFELNDSQAIKSKLVEPTLALYRVYTG